MLDMPKQFSKLRISYLEIDIATNTRLYKEAECQERREKCESLNFSWGVWHKNK